MDTVLPPILTTQMPMVMDIPLDVACDPDFGLDVFLTMEAQFAAWDRYGDDAALGLYMVRVGVPADAPALPLLVRIETIWDVWCMPV